MKCPALMNGYHNRPKLKPFTRDGYYITHDVFRRDNDGFHYFVGRTDDMFVSGGENIYPTDVEKMLEKHPDVAQAVVIPVDDDIKGTKPVAFVIAKAGHSPTEDAIKKYASEERAGLPAPALCLVRRRPAALLDQQGRPPRVAGAGGTARRRGKAMRLSFRGGAKRRARNPEPLCQRRNALRLDSGFARFARAPE